MNELKRLVAEEKLNRSRNAGTKDQEGTEQLPGLPFGSTMGNLKKSKEKEELQEHLNYLQNLNQSAIENSVVFD